MNGNIALVGGQVRTLDATDSIAEALLIVSGRVALVGTSEEVLRAAGDEIPMIDLDGRTVLPGLIDAHTHLELGARAEEEWVDVRGVTPATTLERLAEAAGGRPAGAWIVAQGTFGQPLPTREEIDRVAPDHLVVIRQSMHRQVVNSRALGAAGIDRTFVPPVGIRVYRDAGGEATGEIDEGFDLFPVPVPDVAWFEDVLPRQTRLSFVRHGVTTIHELPASHEAIAAWQRLDASGRMPCRITLNPIVEPGHQATLRDVEDFLRPGLTTGFGTEWLKLGAVKLFLDGAGIAAWTREQLAGPPADWGLAPFAFNDLVRILGACRRAGVQVWMHALGDIAQALALDAVEATNRAHPGSPHRTRVEHIGNERNDPATFARVRAAGIVPVPTAAFMNFTPVTPDLEKDHPFPYRTMLDAGLTLPGNSDSAGTQPFATNPWHGIWCMATRRNAEGATLPHPEQALSVPEAVRLYTHHGARATLEEHSKGSLEAGRFGDVAVYADDPFELPLDDLRALVADLTIVGGTVVHEREPASATPTAIPTTTENRP
jgi:predicted amidohydrolase YtcJ